MQPERVRDTGAAVVAAVLIVVSVAALWESQVYSSMGSLFPRAIGLVLLVSSGVALWRALTGRSESRGIGRDGGLLRSALLVLVMVAWIGLLEVFGFFVTSVVAFLLLALVANRDPLTLRRLALFAVVAVVAILAFQQLFAEVLKVRLPGGTSGWW